MNLPTRLQDLLTAGIHYPQGTSNGEIRDQVIRGARAVMMSAHIHGHDEATVTAALQDPANRLAAQLTDLDQPISTALLLADMWAEITKHVAEHPTLDKAGILAHLQAVRDQVTASDLDGGDLQVMIAVITRWSTSEADYIKVTIHPREPILSLDSPIPASHLPGGPKHRAPGARDETDAQ